MYNHGLISVLNKNIYNTNNSRNKYIQIFKKNKIRIEPDIEIEKNINLEIECVKKIKIPIQYQY